MARVLMPIAEGFEELEAVSVVDILRRGNIEVVVASLKPGPVRASRGTVLVADAVLDAVMDADFDMIVLPGGMPGVKHLHEDARVKALLLRYRDQGRYTAAICAAPSILADYGLLDGKLATSNPNFKDKVDIAGVKYMETPVVKDGRVVTSRSAGTAMDFALELVELLAGAQARAEVETGLVRA